MNPEQDFNVTKKNVEEAIVQELHLQVGYKTSVCVLILNTGTECVGTFAPVEIKDGEPVDVATNKKKARASAAKKAFASIKAVAEWRKAVFVSDQARKKQAEEQAKQAEEQAKQAAPHPDASQDDNDVPDVPEAAEEDITIE